MVVEVEQPGLEKIKLQGNPIKMSETDPRPRGPAPSLGEDNNAVLMGLLRLTQKEVEKLHRDGVI
jgi:crotonobetainyl-CoA:carnitine CoA-transferase CaiB-like acyl-CoA transferase